MPRKKSAPQKEMATPLAELLGDVPLRPKVHKLSYEERTELAKLTSHPTFKKAWENALLARPRIFASGTDGQHGLQIGNNRLHQLQGFEMFRAAFLLNFEDSKLEAPKPIDEFPDSGTLEAEVQRKIRTEAPK